MPGRRWTAVGQSVQRDVAAGYRCAAVASKMRGSVTQPPAAIYKDPREICNVERFQPMCADGEVLFMTEAMYGRMTIGRCVRTDYGYVSCRVNLISYLDRKWSCELGIPDQGSVIAATPNG